jgi:hypothetical protein
MARSQMHPEAADRAGPVWSTALPPFEVTRRTDLRLIVLDDAKELLERYGEFPSLRRYLGVLDPERHASIAEELLAFAFDLAPAGASELAGCWKRDHPEWTDAIDRARAVAAMLEALGPDVDGGSTADDSTKPAERTDVLPSVGPPGPDGRGRYRLVERVGAGSHGLVFRAIDHVLSQCGTEVTVAVKVIGCGAADIEASLREAGAARAVSHGSVARVLDAGVAPTDLAQSATGGPTAIFIVAEFIEGVPLYIWKAAHPHRTAAECARIARAVADAIDSCHAAGVVHGDISPANVLVEPTGAVRVVDFGLASRRAIAPDLTEIADGATRDRRRIVALMRWLVRDLPSSRHVRAEVDAVERRCAGLPPRRTLGVDRGVTLATAALLLGLLVTAYVLARRQTPDPVVLLFGDALDTRPDLVELTRDLLDDGMPTIWSDEVFAAKVRALREEVTAARRRGEPSRDLELLAALAVLPTPERLFARPFAALAVDGGLGSDGALLDRPAVRRELAWAIAWSFEAGGGTAPPEESTRIEALSRRLGAPGLFRLLQVEPQPRERAR